MLDPLILITAKFSAISQFPVKIPGLFISYQLKNIKHLMNGTEGNSEFFFPRISMFPETKLRETLRFEGNKIHCSPRDQALSDLLCSKNGSNRWKTNNHVIDK